MRRAGEFLIAFGWYELILVLLLPALLINLGLMTYIDDEAIRALVSQEMAWSGQYLTPTLHGSPYLNKPPLFNWLILAISALTGQISAWTTRLTNVAALIAFGAVIYQVYSRIYDRRTGFLVALMVITCGRILFWDAMLGLIDTTFSLVIFSLMITVYYMVKAQRWWWLFSTSYLLCTVGFLLKGLPALVFQGLTLVTWLWWTGHTKKLWSREHALGLLIFGMALGLYYGSYLAAGGSSAIFGRLFEESAKRTVVTNGPVKMIMHLITFPAEMTYHFLPWTLLVIYFFKKGLVRWIRQDDFLVFQSVTGMANLLIYWASPAVFPRYLLMFTPLFFSFLLRLHHWHMSSQTMHYRLITNGFKIIIPIITLLMLVPLSLERLEGIPERSIKVALTTMLMMVIIYGTYVRKADIWLMTVATLLVMRISFNLFVLPDRYRHDYGTLCRQNAVNVGFTYKDKPMYIYRDTDIQPMTSFYLSFARGQIIPRLHHVPGPDTLLIVDTVLYPLNLRDRKTLQMRHFDKTLVVGFTNN